MTGEITYGLERLAMYIRGVDSVYDLGSGAMARWVKPPTATCSIRTKWSNPPITLNTPMWISYSPALSSMKEAQQLLALENPLPLPAYERILKAAHSFNLLDARKAISVTERQRYILRIRTLTKAVAEAYYASREALGFPMCNKDK